MSPAGFKNGALREIIGPRSRISVTFCVSTNAKHEKSVADKVVAMADGY